MEGLFSPMAFMDWNYTDDKFATRELLDEGFILSVVYGNDGIVKDAILLEPQHGIMKAEYLDVE